MVSGTVASQQRFPRPAVVVVVVVVFVIDAGRLPLFSAAVGGCCVLSLLLLLLQIVDPESHPVGIPDDERSDRYRKHDHGPLDGYQSSWRPSAADLAVIPRSRIAVVAAAAGCE